VLSLHSINEYLCLVVEVFCSRVEALCSIVHYDDEKDQKWTPKPETRFKTQRGNQRRVSYQLIITV
jgi:hypothetical protein